MIEQKTFNNKKKLNKTVRLVALEIWILVFYKNKKFDDIIKKSFDFNKLDKRDKSFLFLLINTCMRRHNQAQKIYNKYSRFGIKKKNRYLNGILVISTIQLIWLNIAPYAVLNEAVNQAKIYIGEKQSKLVNAILRKIVTNKNDCLNFIPEDKCNLPEWLLKSWTSSYGEKNVNEIAKIAMEPPPLDIVVSNKMKESELNQFKLNLSGKKILPNVIRCNLKESVESLPGFSDGLWWIQDAASQIPCNLLLSKIKQHFSQSIDSIKVVDMCCAPGGKTAQLLDNKLDVVSIEKNKLRSHKFKENMKRLNFNPCLIIAKAEDYLPNFKPDVILIDAPCSATGTIRKNPDIFIKPAPINLNDLILTQDNILSNASKILKKNGLIMYVTCSLQKIEGERRIEKFLKKNQSFSIVPFFSTDYPMISDCITKEGFIRILPNYFNFNSDDVMNGTDGFFIALVKMEN